MPPVMLRRLTTFLALFVIGSAPVVAQDRSYPSLAKRPVESRDRTPPPPAPVQQAAADPALDAEIAKLGEQASKGETAFRAQVEQGRSAVTGARGAALNSEAWVSGQMAISALDSARYDSVAALAGLDTLYVERQDNIDAGRVSADLAAIDPVRSRVLATVDAQNDTLDGFRISLRQP